MKKNVLFLFAFLFSLAFYAQQEERILKLDNNNNLIKVTYYHDNGVVSQTGFYTLDGKLQGEWLAYDTEGNKVVSANYDHGKKVGKWFYWNDETLKEVDYLNSRIASVNEWKNTKNLAVRN